MYGKISGTYNIFGNAQAVNIKHMAEIDSYSYSIVSIYKVCGLKSPQSIIISLC